MNDETQNPQNLVDEVDLFDWRLGSLETKDKVTRSRLDSVDYSKIQHLDPTQPISDAVKKILIDYAARKEKQSNQYELLEPVKEKHLILRTERIVGYRWPKHAEVVRCNLICQYGFKVEDVERMLGFRIEQVTVDDPMSGHVYLRRLDPKCMRRFQDWCINFWSFVPRIEQKLMMTLALWGVGYIRMPVCINWFNLLHSSDDTEHRWNEQKKCWETWSKREKFKKIESSEKILNSLVDLG